MVKARDFDSRIVGSNPTTPAMFSAEPIVEEYESHDLGVEVKTSPSSAYIRRAELKLRCVQYLGGKCEACGYCRCREALEFHHRNPRLKDFSVSRARNMGWVKIRAELDKCLLLCANCHREVHAGIILVDELGYLV